MMSLINGHKHRIGQTVNINLTDGSHPSGLAVWNDITNLIVLTTSIHNSAGVTTGWTLTPFIHGSANYYDATGPAWGNADFPDAVINSQYYAQPGGNDFGFVLSGLNPAKTYTVKTISADNAGGDGIIIVTVQSTSHNTGIEPTNIAIELTFTGIVTDGSGNLTLTVSGSGYPLLNAVIIIEN
jgi:hypothetical protein